METAAAEWPRRLRPSASGAAASLSGHLCCGARPLTPRGTRLPASRSSPHTLPDQRPTLARLLNRPCRDSFRRRGAAKSPEYPASAVNRSGNLPALRMAPPAPLPRLPSICPYLLTSDFPRSVPSSSDPVTADKPTVVAVVDIFFFSGSRNGRPYRCTDGPRDGGPIAGEHTHIRHILPRRPTASSSTALPPPLAACANPLPADARHPLLSLSLSRLPLGADLGRGTTGRRRGATGRGRGTTGRGATCRGPIGLRTCWGYASAAGGSR